MHEDLEALMSEAPGGVDIDAEQEFLHAGGWGIKTTEGGRQRADSGMVAHRGTVHPDEYVDQDVLREAAEQALGFTYAEVSAVYARGGRLSPELREQREKIDARLLALSHAGGLQKLADILGVNESTIDRALRRARAAHVQPIVKNPAVVKPKMCFIEGTMDAKPRRRQHHGCPAHMMPLPQYRDGTINLSDRAYARRKG